MNFYGVFFFLLIFIGIPMKLLCQDIINAYAKVTAISGMDLTLSNVDLTYGGLQAGDNIIIMQMQDDIIGSNTGNDANFGTISSISSAGLYEPAKIASLNSGGTQTFTIWDEDFEDLADGNTVDNGTTAWSRACSGGGTNCFNFGRTLEVDATNSINGNLSFSGNDLDEEAVWTSESIDISDFTDVTISVNLAEVNFNQGTDYIRVYYSLDGGAEQELSYTVTPENNFNTSTASTASSLNGSSLVVVVRMRNSRVEEYATFDDVLVQGDKYVPSSITLQSPLTNTYNTGTNSSVQIISFPGYSDFTTTNDLTALAWDGNIGGVFAMDVTDTLTLAHNISVDGLGFNGGVPNPTPDGSGCDPNTYRTATNTYARKGEGIYKVTTTTYEAGRGKIASGGGGGSFHNAGGGGGGNFTMGGNGGPGWNGDPAGCNPTSGGLGGEDLSNYISGSRLFMGGGGGGGQQNNNVSNQGGNGGGIVIIRASTVLTNTGCGGIFVTANGENSQDSGNDGGSGAGAGGTILFQVSNWALSCQLDTEAIGGTGASVDFPDAHGGGGGGGKGVTIFSGSAPSSNYSSDNSQGSGGANGTGGSAGNADNGEPTPDNPTLPPDGIVEEEQGPLPVVLLFWKGQAQAGKNILSWATASEENNHYFTLERSLNGKDWEVKAIIEGNGTTKEKTDYQYIDYNDGHPLIYYRLSQTDFDGTTEAFEAIAVKSLISQINLVLYPNPSKGSFRIDFSENINSSALKIRVFDTLGKMVDLDYEWKGSYLLFDSETQPRGNYLLEINDGVNVHHFRVVVQ